MNLSHCSASNTATSTGGTYSNTLTPEEGYEFVRSGPSLGGFTIGGGDNEADPPAEEAGVSLFCTVAMGNENVTTEAFDISTGEILIEEVTGDIVVTVTDSESEEPAG